MKNILVFLFVVSFIGSIKAQNDSILYSFFAAGHTYGSPMNPQFGLYDPFVDYIPTINNYPNMTYGVFTGDVVVTSTIAYWDSAIVDMNKLNMPTYIAAGNHDIGPNFTSKFGDYYFSFKHDSDLFIVLTPGLDSWNIMGSQLDFLTSTLDSNYSTVDNIFIFMHQLIWWSPVNEYQYVDINFEPQYPGWTNYETVVKPLLLSYPNEFTIYAGDLGSNDNVSPFMYHSFDNITLIGSGMGGGIRDNIIITDVYEDSIHHNLVAINGNDPDALGKLTDYVLIINYPQIISAIDIRIYPNPCSNYLNVENNLPVDLKISIYNNYGQLIQAKPIHKNSNNVITCTGLNPGVYFLHLNGNEVNIRKKIIVQ